MTAQQAIQFAADSQKKKENSEGIINGEVCCVCLLGHRGGISNIHHGREYSQMTHVDQADSGLRPHNFNKFGGPRLSWIKLQVSLALRGNKLACYLDIDILLFL